MKPLMKKIGSAVQRATSDPEHDSYEKGKMKREARSKALESRKIPIKSGKK